MLNGNNHTIRNLYLNTSRTIITTIYENVTDTETGEIY